METLVPNLGSKSSSAFLEDIDLKFKSSGGGSSVTKSCLTLVGPPVFSVHGVLQAEYWKGLPFPPPGDLPNPGIKPLLLPCRRSPAL